MFIHIIPFSDKFLKTVLSNLHIFQTFILFFLPPELPKLLFFLHLHFKKSGAHFILPKFKTIVKKHFHQKIFKVLHNGCFQTSKIHIFCAFEYKHTALF